MKLKMYAIKDGIANRYGQPFLFASDDMARRQFVNMLQGQSVTVRSTFVLYSLGIFDDETAEIDVDFRKLMIGNDDWQPPTVDKE